MFYAEQDNPSKLWYVYNTNRADGGAFGSYRKCDDAVAFVRKMNKSFIWDDKTARLVVVP